ncbi:PBS lyase HEAT domain protein repeat-containing protein [Isosphaera pallida ATCC 43644]|uniref:PBS lyase HEAT domain protein repeat-containing protein n=1 Tax=Isosphaera pallida (strain ATCC 43644 / DSM 9630 / IS1B) TaxID=575540 RepID=E8R6L7_ISOPI|nr:hypothetical protein [Isosphaera pallida]ADV62928.1 PBS lyase HEAT domain protein repeat-containing protein [Isosphaera pallida ATCC 43644]
MTNPSFRLTGRIAGSPSLRWLAAFAVTTALVLGWTVIPAGGPRVAQSQPPAGRDDPAKKQTPAPAKNEAEPPDIDEEEDQDAPVVPSSDEIVYDPAARKLLDNNFPELPDPGAPSPAEEERLRRAAEVAGGRIEGALVDKYVKHYASELTKREILKTWLEGRTQIDPEGKLSASQARAAQEVEDRKYRMIETAAAKLLEPARLAAAAKNSTFANAYVTKLVEVLTPLLQGNLFTRVQAAQVLARCENSRAVPALVAILNDPTQPYAVKDVAMAGIVVMSNEGRDEQPLRGEAVNLATGLTNFLEANPPPPWPFQTRALQAIGSLRLSYLDIRSNKAEVAAAALAVLADPNARSIARAWAAWALGMMRIPDELADYNFTLPAYWTGRLAVEIGNEAVRISRIRVAIEEEKTAESGSASTSGKTVKEKADFPVSRVRGQAGLLIYPITKAFIGDTAALESGFTRGSTTHPGISKHRVAIAAIADKVKAVARASLELSNSAGGLIPQSRAKLEQAVADLAAHLDKNPPPSWKLTPSTREFKPAP